MTLEQINFDIGNTTALADSIGVTRATIYNWLKGAHVPDPGLLELLEIKYTLWTTYFPDMTYREFDTLVDSVAFIGALKDM